MDSFDTVSNPPQSPFFRALNADRYERQSMIAAYEQKQECRLAVMIGPIFDDNITLFEDLIYDADPNEDLHLMLSSPGGDGEAAVRLARSIQARCREFTVIVPNQAKSAATLLALSAHHIVMAPHSDLGPVDAQMFLGERLVAAKDIIAAVDDADEKVNANPDTYPFHVSMLADLTHIMVQEARTALYRSQDLLVEALRSNLDRNAEQVTALSDALKDLLVDRPQIHAALFSADDGLKAGIPIVKADLSGEQWQLLWRLWTKYFLMGRMKLICEGRRASHVYDYPIEADA